VDDADRGAVLEVAHAVGNAADRPHRRISRGHRHAVQVGREPVVVAHPQDDLVQLGTLTLHGNHLSGSLPSELGNLTNLRCLWLHGNGLTGEIPATLANLVSINSGDLDLRWNGLYTDNATLRTFLDSIQAGGDFEATQTVAPKGLSIGLATATTVRLDWTPISYVEDGGGYRVYVATTQGGPYTLALTTSDKSADTVLVTGLIPGQAHYFVLDTVTPTHAHNANEIVSAHSEEASVTTAGTGSLGFYTVSPCRVVDTRDPVLSGPNPLATDTDTPFQIAGQCGVASGARSVSVNVTVTQPTAAGHLRLYPSDQPRPTASVLNYRAGQTRANNAIVPLSALGGLAVYVKQASGTAHVIIDVNGYFE